MRHLLSIETHTGLGAARDVAWNMHCTMTPIVDGWLRAVWCDTGVPAAEEGRMVKVGSVGTALVWCSAGQMGLAEIEAAETKLLTRAATVVRADIGGRCGALGAGRLLSAI